MKRYAHHSLAILAFVLSPVLFAQTAKSHLKEGKSAIKAEQYEAAVHALTKSLALDNKNSETYRLRAIANEHTDRYLTAARDYQKASEIKPSDYKSAHAAGVLYYNMGRYEESVYCLNMATKAKAKFLDPYLYKVNCLIALGNYKEALLASELALGIKSSAENYFYHGLVSEHLRHYEVAEADYRKSIKKDKLFKESYLGLASTLLKQNKSDEALVICSKAIVIDTSFTDAYIKRSAIHFSKSDLISANADISKAISLAPGIDTLYLLRAGFLVDLKQQKAAIADYSKALELNPGNFMAHYKRGELHEAAGNKAAATSDYRAFIAATAGNATFEGMRKDADKRIYDLNLERNKPVIAVTSAVVKNNNVIEVALNKTSIMVTVKVTDENPITELKINNEKISVSGTQNEIESIQDIPLDGIDRISIIATDIYHNTSAVAYTIVRTEINPPVIKIVTPYTSAYNEIFLESEKEQIFIEGKITDESQIQSVLVDGNAALFDNSKTNPTFTLDLDVTGKNEIVISSTDVYGNTTEETYKLNRENAKILASNPMGKTWVIFINNSDYESFASLDGPAMDVSTMRAAFSKYDIHNVIEKKNMTKRQLERFFQIELRDYVREQKVNSLLVWYAGHGKFINETGYWIPVDADREDEFTYFNINALKAFMQSYSTFITHVLVVSDACESGPSFYAAMRGSKERDCGDYSSTKFKSSQVFSSAGYELAADNSPFTKTFARSLNYNTDNCIAIDNIVVKVTEAVRQNQKQSPKFGKINGLEDEDGTFFFIKK